MRIDVFPVGIETAGFAKLAQRSARSAFVQHVQDSLSGRVQIIGVDRLDYTKGLPERLQAFRNAIERFPELREQVILFQLTVPSREGVPEYQALKARVERRVGRAVGHEVSWRRRSMASAHGMEGAAPAVSTASEAAALARRIAAGISRPAARP